MCHPPIDINHIFFQALDDGYHIVIRWREGDEELDVSQHCYSWWVDYHKWFDVIGSTLYMCIKNKSGPPKDPWGTHCTLYVWDLCVIRCRKLKRSSIFFCNTYSLLGVFPYHIWSKVNPHYQWYQEFVCSKILGEERSMCQSLLSDIGKLVNQCY